MGGTQNKTKTEHAKRKERGGKVGRGEEKQQGRAVM